MVRLRRSDPAKPGYTRVDGSAALLGRDGRRLRDPQELRRVAELVIPPAWTDVWVCADAAGHIQAIGTDQAGRRQYIYHPAWRQRRDQAKFERSLALAASLPAARRTVTRELRLPGFPKRRLLAAGFRIIDLGSLRVGSEEYLHANGSRGLTTLLCRHAAVEGSRTTLTFPAKSGQRWSSAIEDDDLAALMRSLTAARGPRSRLLSWHDDRWHGIHPVELNAYIRERTHGDFTAKDFRTLKGTIAAASALARAGVATTESAKKRAIAAAVQETAEILGNTRAVARNSYIDPRVFDRYRAGQVLESGAGRSPEAALRSLIDG